MIFSHAEQLAGVRETDRQERVISLVFRPCSWTWLQRYLSRLSLGVSGGCEVRFTAKIGQLS